MNLCNISQSLWQVNHGGHCEKQQQVKTTTYKCGMTLCNISYSLLQVNHGCDLSPKKISADELLDWAELHIKLARMTLTIKLDRNWNSFQFANSAPPLSVTDSANSPSARMPVNCDARLHVYAQMLIFNKPHVGSCLLGVHDLELSWTRIVRGDRNRYSGTW